MFPGILKAKNGERAIILIEHLVNYCVVLLSVGVSVCFLPSSLVALQVR